eukprot:Skav210921  [mRNA]  locus=scaffold2014:2096:6039:- [translate_table: standard]
MLQTHMHQTLRKWDAAAAMSGAGGSSAAGLNNMAETLLADIQSDPFVKQDDSMETVIRRVLDSKGYMSKAKEWIVDNNVDKIGSQPAYTRFMNNVKTVCCTCDSEAWDADPCDFHMKCEHGLPDLLWGLAEIICDDGARRGDRCVPDSVRMVGVSALASIRVLNQKEAEFAADVAAAGDDDDQKKAKKPILESVVGALGDFLLVDTDKGKTLNVTMLTNMITARAAYVLNALESMIRRPYVPGHTPEGNFISMIDVPRPDKLEQWLNYLGKSSAGAQYICQVESRYQFMVQSSESHDSWSAIWARLLHQTLSKEPSSDADSEEANAAKESKDSKSSKDSKDGKKANKPAPAEVQWEKFLPNAAKIIKGKTLLASVPKVARGMAADDDAGVKAEETAEATPAVAATVDLQADGEHAFSDIYTLSDAGGNGKLNAMDVIVVGQEIRSFIMRKAAASNNAEGPSQLLKALIGDPKTATQCVLRTASLKLDEKEDPSLRQLLLFGAVATATFDNDIKVDYYLQSDGFAKVTNAVPCPVWLFKAGYSEDKALFKTICEDVQVDIVDAFGQKRPVLIKLMGVQLRPNAFRTIVRKGTVDVLCTRSALPGEPDSAKGGGKSKGAKQSLVIGGLALQKAKGKGKGKAKIESTTADAGAADDSDPSAWSWLYSSSAPKCAAHLLR